MIVRSARMANLSEPDPPADEAPDTQPDAIEREDESGGVGSPTEGLERRLKRSRRLIGLLGVALLGALGFGALQFRKARSAKAMVELRQKDADDATTTGRAERILRLASEPRSGHGNEALAQAIALVGRPTADPKHCGSSHQFD